jgi:hypothetical protein
MSPVSPALALVSLLALAGGATADAPAYEIDLTDVANAPDACPSQDQLAEAIDAHLPGLVARPGREPGGARVLHLTFTLSPEGVARIAMTDATGAPRLERDLDLPKSEGGPGHPVDRERTACAAVADTVALIVERYMRHLGYREPPPPALVAPPAPPPPAPPPAQPPRRADRAARLGVGLSARPPWRAPWRFEPSLAAAVRYHHLEVAASAAVGLSGQQSLPAADGPGTLKLTTYPARLAVGWALPLGARLSLVPSLAAGLDVVLAQTQGIDKTRRSAAVEPTLEGGMTALVVLTRRIWIDAHAFQGMDVRPEEFEITGASGQVTNAFMTPRVYTRIGVDFGVFLGKN